MDNSNCTVVKIYYMKDKYMAVICVRGVERGEVT